MNGPWEEHRQHVTAELDRLSKGQEDAAKSRKEIHGAIIKNREDVIKLQMKAGAVGAIPGLAALLWMAVQLAMPGAGPVAPPITLLPPTSTPTPYIDPGHLPWLTPTNSQKEVAPTTGPEEPCEHLPCSFVGER